MDRTAIEALKGGKVQYVPVKAMKTSAVGKRAPGARVLTSDECTQILVKQEKKKKKELEEKAQRKAERERESKQLLERRLKSAKKLAGKELKRKRIKLLNIWLVMQSLKELGEPEDSTYR